MRSPPFCGTPLFLHQITNHQIKKCAAHLSAAALFPCTNPKKLQKCHKPTNQKMRSPPFCGTPLFLHQITNHQITKMRSPPNQKNAQPTCLRLPSLPAPNNKPPNHKNAQPTKSKECAAYLSAAALSPCTKSKTTKSQTTKSQKCAAHQIKKNAQPTCLQLPSLPAPPLGPPLLALPCGARTRPAAHSSARTNTHT